MQHSPTKLLNLHTPDTHVMFQPCVDPALFLSHVNTVCVHRTPALALQFSQLTEVIQSSRMLLKGTVTSFRLQRKNAAEEVFIIRKSQFTHNLRCGHGSKNDDNVFLNKVIHISWRTNTFIRRIHLLSGMHQSRTGKGRATVWPRWSNLYFLYCTVCDISQYIMLWLTRPCVHFASKHSLLTVQMTIGDGWENHRVCRGKAGRWKSGLLCPLP